MSALERLPAGPFRQTDAARAGISSRTLYRLRDAGHLETIGRGLYRRADAPAADLDLLEIATRARQATICLVSALARHGLTDTIPARIDIALPRGRTGPATTAPVTWHYFDKATFDLGRDTITIDGTDTTIGMYSPERSIVDAFRMRGTHGYELATEALRTWLNRRGSHPARLIQLAEQLPRATGPLRTALDVLT